MLALGGALPSSTASAQGLFEMFFGGLRRSAPPPNANSYADPNGHLDRSGQDPARQGSGGRTYAGASGGGSGVYCVRLCDGRYFPLQRTGGAASVEQCNSFCPAAKTKVYSGGTIDHAVARDGTRYSNLDTAFAYREKTVANCSCNGKDAYGLVTQSVKQDPTLRPGDIVATDSGFVTYNGGRRNAEFTPVESQSGVSADVRAKLAETQILPRNVEPAPESNHSALDDNRQASLD
jgi:hypothetical protein